jgi:hypothetical protein
VAALAVVGQLRQRKKEKTKKKKRKILNERINERKETLR